MMAWIRKMIVSTVNLTLASIYLSLSLSLFFSLSLSHRFSLLQILFSPRKQRILGMASHVSQLVNLDQTDGDVMNILMLKVRRRCIIARLLKDRRFFLPFSEIYCNLKSLVAPLLT